MGITAPDQSMMIKDRPTLAEVVDKLQTLGSADQIALFFEQQGVKGFPGKASRCPVANYVKSQTGRICTATQTCIDDEGEGFVVIEDTTSPISQFITSFDHYNYPALEWPADA